MRHKKQKSDRGLLIEKEMSSWGPSFKGYPIKDESYLMDEKYGYSIKDEKIDKMLYKGSLNMSW